MAEANRMKDWSTRLIYSWRKRKVPKRQAGTRIRDFCASKPEAPAGRPRTDGDQRQRQQQVKRRGKWFSFVNKVSNKVLIHFWDSLLSNLSGAHFFNCFQSLGSAGAAYTVLAPYFVTFTIFSRDGVSAPRAMEHFAVSRSSTRHNKAKQAKIAHFTDTFNEINGVALTIAISSIWPVKPART